MPYNDCFTAKEFGITLLWLFNVLYKISYMARKNKHNITFRLDNRRDKNGEVAILIVLTFCGRRVTVSTGVRVAPDNWDSKAMRPKKTAVNHGQMNAMAIIADITAKANILEDVFSGFPSPTTEAIRNEYRRRIAPESLTVNAKVVQPKTVLEWLTAFVIEMSILREWTDATREKFNALGNHIAAVDPQMTFEDLDEHGLTRLLGHFRSMIMQDGSVGMKNSTIAKQFGYLGWFLNWAVKKGVNHNLAYKTFAPALKHTQKKVIYLDDGELARLQEVDLTPANRRHLERIRDIFLFQCYSGLRYSDVASLRWADIKDDVMTITTVKTTDTITIELNAHTRALLKKYAVFSFLPGNKVFPAPTNQEANRYLKELCRLAGINEPVTIVTYKGKERIDEVRPKYDLIGTHAGRRTFIVHALSLGISPYIVTRWTGHSSLAAMKPYMDVVDSAKADAMKLFDTPKHE